MDNYGLGFFAGLGITIVILFIAMLVGSFINPCGNENCWLTLPLDAAPIAVIAGFITWIVVAWLLGKREANKDSS